MTISKLKSGIKVPDIKNKTKYSIPRNNVEISAFEADYLHL